MVENLVLKVYGNIVATQCFMVKTKCVNLPITKCMYYFRPSMKGVDWQASLVYLPIEKMNQ